MAPGRQPSTLAAAGAAVTRARRASAGRRGAGRSVRARAGVRVILGALMPSALGRRRGEGRALHQRAGRQQRLPCDLLCISAGWSPAVHLTSHTGVKPVYRPDIDAFVPGPLAAGHFGAGAVIGVLDAEEALASGVAAGSGAARHAGGRGGSGGRRLRISRRRFRRRRPRGRSPCPWARRSSTSRTMSRPGT